MVAFAGEIVATSVIVAFGFTCAFVLFNVIPVTGTFTVILQVACTSLPSVDFAVIIALPLTFVVTNPLLSTVATASLLLLHSNVLFSAFSGNTVAFSCNVVFGFNAAVVLSNVIVFTNCCIASLTTNSLSPFLFFTPTLIS